jgi:hypothetical protein
MKAIQVILLATAITFSTIALAEETPAEKADIATDKATDQMKSTYRAAKEKVCHMVKGKLECAAEEAKDKVLDATDKAKTGAKEIKDKAD